MFIPFLLIARSFHHVSILNEDFEFEIFHDTDMVLFSNRGETGITLAQLVKASVGQADVQRFEPRLGHNWLSCGVFLVKSRHFGLPVAQTIRPKLVISLSGWLGRYTNVEYLQSLYLKKRGQLHF